MSWLKQATEIHAIEEILKAWRKKLEAEPKENWQASMACEVVERLQDDFVQRVYDLYHIADFPKPTDFKHWRDKPNADDHCPI
jgi:hypothetical protein